MSEKPVVIKGCTCPGYGPINEECAECPFRAERVQILNDNGKETIDLAREFKCFSCGKKKPRNQAKGSIDKTTGEGECLDCWNVHQG